MQLHEFSKEQLQDMLAAVQKTKELHQYALDIQVSYREAKEHFITRCPLCLFDRDYGSSCEACPWMVLNARGCFEYADSKASVRRLAGWEDQIKEAIHAES